MGTGRRQPTLPGLVLSICAACSTSAAEPPSPAAAPVETAPAAGRAPCSEPVEQRPAGSTCVKTVQGTLVEPVTGAPLPSLLVTVCGGICFAGSGDATGFSVPINRFVDLSTYVLHVDGRPDHANVFLHLARASSESVVLAEPTRVPRLDQRGPSFSETPNAASSVLRAGDVTLTLAPSTEVQLDFADVALEAEGRVLRSGSVGVDAFGDPNLVALHALAPFGATLTPAVEIAIALPPGVAIADGTAVELVALDDDLLSPAVGTLHVIASATVSGGIARSDAGNGIGRLTWVGVRTKGKP